jgi:hypothetical protein
LENQTTKLKLTKEKEEKIKSKTKDFYMIGGVGAPALRADVTALLIWCVFLLPGRAVASAATPSSGSSISRTNHRR